MLVIGEMVSWWGDPLLSGFCLKVFLFEEGWA